MSAKLKFSCCVCLLLGFYMMAASLIREYIYISQILPLPTAQAYCRQRYGDLDSITTEEEYQRVFTVIGQRGFRVFIGLNRIAPHVNIWQWTDGTQPNFTKWAIGEPEDQSPGESCVIMKEFGWCDTPCGRQFASICSRRLTLVKEKKTWDEALKHCRSHYIDLVFVDSGAQLDLLKIETQQTQTASVWTGLRFLDEQWLSGNGMPLGSVVSCPVWLYRCGAYNFNTNNWEKRDCNEPLNFYY